MIKSIKTNWDLITGLIIIFINLYWIWDNLYLMYLYHQTGMLFLFMYPDWVLILNSVIGIVGIVIGIRIIKLKVNMITGILLDFAVLLIGSVLKFVSIL